MLYEVITDGAVGFRQFHEIDGQLHTGLTVTFLEEELLPLADHAQKIIIENA